MEYIFNVAEGYENWTVKDFLRSCGVSAAAIRAVKLLPNGILCNGEKIYSNARVKAGDKLCIISAQDKETRVPPQDIPIEILYESENVMVVNKPAGMPVHPTRGHALGTLANAFCGLMEKRGTPMPFRAVNRIDRNTSGLVLLSLNSFSVPFLLKSAKKEYFAILQGELLQKAGVIDAPIARSGESIITREVNEHGQEAITEYTVLSAKNGVSFIKANLVTGRTHQIRVHFSHLGFSLCGDDLYGGSTEKISRHALHCGTVFFTEPLKGIEIKCVAPLPQDMANVLNSAQIIW